MDWAYIAVFVLFIILLLTPIVGDEILIPLFLLLFINKNKKLQQ